MAQSNGIRGFFKGVDFQYAATVIALKIVVPLMIKVFAYSVDKVAGYVEYLLGIDQQDSTASHSEGVLVADVHSNENQQHD